MPGKLREYGVLFKRVRRNEVAHPNKTGMRSKLGGDPDWEQVDETPECSCGQEMTFIAQIDSIEQYERHNPHKVHRDAEEGHVWRCRIDLRVFLFRLLQDTIRISVRLIQLVL